MRLRMNQFMGISGDKDVLKINSPPQEVTESFESDGGHDIQPSLQPMQPCLTNVYCSWNQRLWELFQQDSEEKAEFTEETLVEMASAFFERLKRLKRKLKELTPAHGESHHDHQERYKSKQSTILKGQRANSRRSRVSHQKDLNWQTLTI